MNSQEILAVVAGENITNADLDAFLQGVPKEQKLYAQDPQFREQFLEQMIAFLCYAKYGEEMGLDKTEEFEDIMKKMKKEFFVTKRQKLFGFVICRSCFLPSKKRKTE